MDASDRFFDTLVEVLTAYQVAEEEAQRLARQTRQAYLSVVNVSGSTAFELLDVTLRLHALCRDLLAGAMAGDLPAALAVVVGVLRWLEGERGIYPRRGIDHIEAATCLALCKQESEAVPYSPDDTVEGLFVQVDDLLQETPFGVVGAERARAAMSRLKELNCLTGRKGGHRLRDEIVFQEAID